MQLYRAMPAIESLEARTLMSTCHVTRLSDIGAGMGFRGDLRYCINKVNAEPGPDTIRILRTGTINLASALPNLSSEIDIQGPGADLLTIRGKSQPPVPIYRVFMIPLGGDIAISGLTITNGSASLDGKRGGGIHNAGTLDLSAVVISANTASGGDGEGGGLYNSGNLTIDGSLIGHNDAGGGGGLHNTATGIVVITNTTISGNLAKYFSPGTSFGGGIYNAGMLTLEGCDVRGNNTFGDVRSYGGGIYNIGNLTINNTTVSDSYLVGEFGAFGGGIYSTGTLTLTNSTVSNNTARDVFEDSFGGGIYAAGTLSVSYSTIADNTADGVDHFAAYGGGVYFAGGTGTISNSTIVNNLARGDYENGHGGGIFAAGAITVSNSTIAFNAAESGLADGNGGGFYGRGTITNSTISGNFSSTFGGGIYATAAPLGLRNTILAASYAPQGPDLWGNLSSSGYNLVGDTSGGSGYDVNTDLLNVDPLFGSFGNNGGPTLTFALIPGSPAIEAGDNTDAPEFDQRGPGFPRIVNGTIDIGSFEVQSTGVPGFLVFLITAASDQDELEIIP